MSAWDARMELCAVCVLVCVRIIHRARIYVRRVSSIDAQLTSYSDFPYPKPHYTHFLVPTGILGQIYRIFVFWKWRTAILVVFDLSNQETLFLSQFYSMCKMFAFFILAWAQSLVRAHRNSQLAQWSSYKPHAFFEKTHVRTHPLKPVTERHRQHVFHKQCAHAKCARAIRSIFDAHNVKKRNRFLCASSLLKVRLRQPLPQHSLLSFWLFGWYWDPARVLVLFDKSF